jgi:hypothetical protein
MARKLILATREDILRALRQEGLTPEQVFEKFKDSFIIECKNQLCLYRRTVTPEDDIPSRCPSCNYELRARR